LAVRLVEVIQMIKKIFYSAVSFLFLSNCTLMNFKIKTDDASPSFSKNILSIENAVKTTPVEFATDYNPDFNPQNLINSDARNVQSNQNSDFDREFVQSLAQAQQAAKTKVKQISRNSNEKEPDSIDSDLSSDDSEYVNVRTLSSKSHIKSLKNRKFKTIAQTSNESYQEKPVLQKQGSGHYTVKRGDTLMKISFARYGNVYKWKDILDSNKSKIVDFNKLVPGTELNIEGRDYVVIERNGHPYFIRKNDTLIKISSTVYGDIRKWPLLWKNNRQLIHDPNKIYAGFTLYYLDQQDLKIKKAELKSNDTDRKPSSQK